MAKKAASPFVVTHKKDTAAVLSIHNKKLDVNLSGMLKAEFLLICKDPLKKLVIDMGQVEYCDSTGLSALLLAERKMREISGTIALAAIKPQVKSLLSMSRLDRVFIVSSSVTKALKS